MQPIAPYMAMSSLHVTDLRGTGPLGHALYSQRVTIDFFQDITQLVIFRNFSILKTKK